MAKRVDTIAMLGHVNTQLVLRRDEIKPSLKAEYSAIAQLKCPSLANTFSGTTWQSNCEMPKKPAKLAIPLHRHLEVAPLKGNSKPLTNMTISLKVLKEIFCGKAKTGTTKRKNRQTPTRNNGTTASNKEQGKCFRKFPVQPGDLFTNVMPYT